MARYRGGKNRGLNRGRVAFGALVGLTSVAVTANPAAAKVTITFATGLGGDQLKVMTGRIAEFERQNPDIDVEILSIPGGFGQVRAKVLTMIAAGTAPDVVHSVLNDAPYFIDAGALLDVTPYAREIDRNEYYISDAYVKNGRVWGGFESHIQVVPIYYNAELFAAAGLPTPNDLYQAKQWTWETLRETARKLTRRGPDGRTQQWGFNFPLGWETGWGIFGLSFGAEVISADYRRITLNTPEMRQALELMVQLMRTDQVAPAPGVPLPQGDPIANGSTAMHINGTWRMNWYKQFAGDVPWDVAPTPIGASPLVYRLPGADGVVTAASKHPAEAWRLVRFFLDDYVQMDKAKSKLEIPVSKKALRSSAFLEAPPTHMQAILELLYRSKAQPVYLGMNEVNAAVSGVLSRAFSGALPVQTALVEAERQAQARLNEFLK